MSRFDSQFAAAAASLFHENASAVLYHPKGGDDLALTGIVTAEDADETIDEAIGRTVPRTRELTVMLDPASVYGGVAQPGIDDRVTIDGRVWHVDQVQLYGTTAKLRLVSKAAAGRNKPAYFKDVG